MFTSPTKKLLRVYPGTLGPCSKKETGLRPLQWGWGSLAAKREERGNHNAVSGIGVRWADKPRMAKGQGTSGAPGHLGEQDTSGLDTGEPWSPWRELP